MSLKIYCKRDRKNVEEFYCMTCCENKKYYKSCPFREKISIQTKLEVL